MGTEFMKNRRILVTKSDPELFVKLPKEMLEEVEALAKTRGRSINMQFIMMIAEQLKLLEDKRKAQENMDTEELLKMIFCAPGKEFKVHLRGK